MSLQPIFEGAKQFGLTDGEVLRSLDRSVLRVGDEATVGELVDELRLSQPQVSKHLGVLRSVGLVSVRADGRHRWYRVNGPALKPVHDWVRRFERTWNTRLDRLDDVLAELTTTQEDQQ